MKKENREISIVRSSAAETIYHRADSTKENMNLYRAAR